MGVMKLEEHLYFSSGFKKCLALKDYIQCGSGPTALARTQLLSAPSTGRKLHVSRAAGWRGKQDAAPSLVPKPEALSPVMSPASTILISSSSHARRGNTKS